MAAQEIDLETLAADLGESYGRIAHYVRRGTIPNPPMVKKLMDRTGLPAEAFLFPFDATAQRSAVA